MLASVKCGLLVKSGALVSFSLFLKDIENTILKMNVDSNHASLKLILANENIIQLPQLHSNSAYFVAVSSQRIQYQENNLINFLILKLQIFLLN